MLVTGATGGIGQEVARAFAAEGARVAIGYATRREEAEQLAKELESQGGTAFAVPYRLDEPGSPAAAVDAVVREWGGLDVLVANAFRWGPRRTPGTPFEDVPEDDWLPVLEHNLVPVLHTARHAVRAMRAGGWGRIALVSSHNALGGNRGQEFYGSAKAALHGLARSLMWDTGRDGVLVNLVAPGLTSTDRVRTGLPAAVLERERSATPTGRISTPREIARAVVFLCSDANTNITGETLTVAGGR